MTTPTSRVLLAGFYPPPYAGEPIHVKQLGQFLRAHGLQVDILNLNRHAPPSPDYQSASGRSSIVRSLFGLPDRSSILHLHTNGHNWKSWLMIGVAALAARLKGVKTILTIHSGLFPGYVRTLGSGRRRLSRWILESFGHVIAVNREIAEAMQSLGIRGARLSVIPAYLGVPQAPPLDPADRAVVNGARPLLVAVGGGDRDPELGLPTVIEALPDLARAFPELRTFFIGWQVGPKTQPLIDARDLAKHAVCIGEVSHERCLGLLQAADVVVRSTFTDGDAITVREALDLGIPVVASDTGFRPAGVTLFKKGDSRDLRAKLEQVLGSTPPHLERGADSAQAGRELWRIYSGLLR